MKLHRRYIAHFVEYDPTRIYSKPGMLWGMLLIWALVTIPVTFAYPHGGYARLLLIPAYVAGTAWAAYLSFGTPRKLSGVLLFWCIGSNLLLVPGCLLTAHFAATRAVQVHADVWVAVLLGIAIAYALTVASTRRRIARDGYGTAWARSVSPATAGSLALAAVLGMALARFTFPKMSQEAIAVSLAWFLVLFSLLGINSGVVTLLKLYYLRMLASERRVTGSTR